MHLQPNRNYRSNDAVQTPLALARRIVAHFRPSGRILEPCAGHGNFLRALRAHVARARSAAPPSSDFRPSTFNLRPATRVDWCELERGRDFFAWRDRVDWVITNPPWSQFRAFLRHALTLADEVVFLATINHLWTQARIRDITTARFGLREIVMVAMPPTFPPLGFQLGVVHLSRGWNGPLTLTDWRDETPRAGRAAPATVRPLRTAARATLPPKTRALPSAWMSTRELAALSPQEHLRLILRAA